MAEVKDAHIVEIPFDEEDLERQATATENGPSVVRHHPLAEISRSPGHLLLLKLWQREENLVSRRLAATESRKDAIRGEIFQLCCFFFLFHGLFFTMLFTSSESNRCQKWYWKVDQQLQKERAEGRALTRCIQELRMKGASFDLDKEPQNGKKMKSSSVEIKWRPLRCCSMYRVTIFVVCFAGIMLSSCRLVLCY